MWLAGILQPISLAYGVYRFLILIIGIGQGTTFRLVQYLARQQVDDHFKAGSTYLHKDQPNTTPISSSNGMLQ
ncbi:hypothetical protein VTN77DRAFT_3970 [Rasamsonia byssochlamydoides]|uniref:uncharacterized protein n=1 Tax=Rasamsonia byssochlamydoides TaxID=89139 RepID=UPI003743A2E0